MAQAVQGPEPGFKIVRLTVHAAGKRSVAYQSADFSVGLTADVEQGADPDEVEARLAEWCAAKVRHHLRHLGPAITHDREPNGAGTASPTIPTPPTG